MLKFQSHFSFSDEAANFTKDDLKVSTSLRINSQPADLRKVLLLAPVNGTAIESFIERGNASELSSDEIQSEVCLFKGASKQTKRSVINLHDFGFKSAENDAIVDCGASSGSKCLRLQEIDAPSKSRTIFFF